MNILRNTLTALVPVALLALTTSAAHAQGGILITVDENFHGTINGFAGLQPLPSGMQADTGPGGAANVLTYDLLNPPGLVAGDVLVTEPELANNLGDVIRFNPNQVGPGGGTGVLVFYSNPIGGFDSAADIAAPPGAFYGNTVTLSETLAGDLFYTPIAGQPGFVAGAGAPVTYHIISDAAPEPGSIALLLAAGAPIAGIIARRRKA